MSFRVLVHRVLEGSGCIGGVYEGKLLVLAHGYIQQTSLSFIVSIFGLEYKDASK